MTKTSTEQQRVEEIAALRAALEPFADRIDVLEENCRKLKCGVPAQINVRTLDLYAARAALRTHLQEQAS